MGFITVLCGSGSAGFQVLPGLVPEDDESRFLLCPLRFWRWSSALTVRRSEAITLTKNISLYPLSYKKSMLIRLRLFPKTGQPFNDCDQRMDTTSLNQEPDLRLQSIAPLHGPFGFGQGSGCTANCRYLEETRCRIGYTNHYLFFFFFFFQANCWHILTMLSDSL